MLLACNLAAKQQAANIIIPKNACLQMFVFNADNTTDMNSSYNSSPYLLYIVLCVLTL